MMNGISKKNPGRRTPTGFYVKFNIFKIHKGGILSWKT